MLIDKGHDTYEPWRVKSFRFLTWQMPLSGHFGSSSCMHLLKEKQVLLQGIRGCRKISNHILDTIDSCSLTTLQTLTVYFLFPSLQLLEPGFFGLCLHVLGKFLFTCFAGSLQHIGREGHTITGL